MIIFSGLEFYDSWKILKIKTLDNKKASDLL